MLQSTPMLSRQDSADARACQRDNEIFAWTRTGPVDVGRVVAAVAVAMAYNGAHPRAAVEVTSAAILARGRRPDVAWARHVCAYLLVEDAHVSHQEAARALGRTNHTTIFNSRARVAAALDRDATLSATLAHARAVLAGATPPPVGVAPTSQAVLCHRAPRPRDPFAGATSRELGEYRYWRLRASRAGGAL